MDTNPGPFEWRMQTLWVCLNDASFATIFCDVFEHGAWRRRMNHVLAELYGGPSILTMAKSGRIRWLGHVVRMPD